jgi:hypothetical protein
MIIISSECTADDVNAAAAGGNDGFTGCQPGYYLHIPADLDWNARCLPCPKGRLCPGGGSKH